MPSTIYRLELIAPAFISGASKNDPELRAPTIRGQLRYWLRAIVGAYAPQSIWEKESAAFGSTGAGAPISIRIIMSKSVTPINVPMLPHKTNESDLLRSRQWALPAGYHATLELAPKVGRRMSNDVKHALEVWSLLGGLGKRSRRMFGAVELSGDELTPPESPEALASHLKATLDACIPPTSNASLFGRNSPRFPTLHREHSWIIVGRRGFDSAQDANISLFRELLRTERFRGRHDEKETTFGQAKGGRRASPLIAQVRRCGDKYYPVLTVMRSTPDRNIDWQHMKAFMEAARDEVFNGIQVWGGW